VRRTATFVWTVYQIALLATLLFAVCSLFALFTWGMSAVPFATFVFVATAMILGFAWVLLSASVVAALGVVHWALISVRMVTYRLCQRRGIL
jgi:hypothetical protein